MSETRTKSEANEPDSSDWLAIVREQVEALSYGVVEIVVHDSRVTQIGKTERVRLNKSPEANRQLKPNK